MKFFWNACVRIILKGALSVGWAYPFVYILKAAIKPHPDNRPSPHGTKQPTLLVLSPEGFRGDPDALAKSGRFKVLLMNSSWQYRILYLFYPQGLRIRDYLKPSEDHLASKCKKSIQEFYKSVLTRVYESLGIDGVIGYHFRMPSDVDIGISSSEIGRPYIILYREGLAASSPYLQRTVATLINRFGIWSDYFIVHNYSCRDLIIDSSEMEESRVPVLGCIRMDDFIQNIQSALPVHSKDLPRRIVYFAPALKSEGNFGSGFDMSIFPYFKAVQLSLLNYAVQNPDVELVLKPKPKNFQRYLELLDMCTRDEHVDILTIPNVVCNADLDPQELILNSKIVVGLNSTTLLEGAVAGRHVISTYFDCIKNSPFSDTVKCEDSFDSIDVASNEDELFRLLGDRMNDYEPISEGIMQSRKGYFDTYVSSPKGGAVERYCDEIESMIVAFKSSREGHKPRL